MDFKIFIKGKKIIIPNIKKAGNLLKFRGLMFRRKKNSPILLFDFGKRVSLHSFFVFFEFIVIWLDDRDNVLEVKKIRPFRPHVISKTEFTKIIEIPVDKKYQEVIKKIIQ